MPDANLVDTGLQNILQTGLFGPEYTEWLQRADGTTTWAHLKEFWRKKVRLKSQVSQTARSYGFGGMAILSQEGMQQGINNFAAAHANTVATVSGLQQQGTQPRQML